jgi:hypothetical protein
VDNKKGAKNLWEDSQISYLDSWNFIFHYKWMSDLLRSATTWGGKWQPIVKVGIYIFYYVMLWVPVCLFWRYSTFLSAIIGRIVLSKGGKAGMKVNFMIFFSYIFILWVIYIPFVFPYFGYFNATTLLEMLKII